MVANVNADPAIGTCQCIATGITKKHQYTFPMSSEKLTTEFPTYLKCTTDISKVCVTFCDSVELKGPASQPWRAETILDKQISMACIDLGIQHRVKVDTRELDELHDFIPQTNALAKVTAAVVSIVVVAKLLGEGLATFFYEAFSTAACPTIILIPSTNPSLILPYRSTLKTQTGSIQACTIGSPQIIKPTTCFKITDTQMICSANQS